MLFRTDNTNTNPQVPKLAGYHETTRSYLVGTVVVVHSLTERAESNYPCPPRQHPPQSYLEQGSVATMLTGAQTDENLVVTSQEVHIPSVAT